ncbi:unnamed protein product [Phytophthora fragariaefolia]|uniref:Unnamed protein product n=1 Tax=Phytophthora fragariaefolia TaxID=1490495 RepID=A0A9W6XNS9_9STRA|nr:unnamed protein product [Phytophthora fragariaefolia]
MLSWGGSIELDRVVRRDKITGQQAQVACPRVLKDYQTHMGGVDLCQLREEDWEGLLDNDEEEEATPSKDRTRPQRTGHVPVQNDEWRVGNNNTGRKRRTRACKLCSLLKGTNDARGGDSSIYCSDCKLTTSSKKPMAWRVFLCDKVRHRHNGTLMSCFEIWHKSWRNGTLLPKRAQKRNIRARMPAQTADGENVEGDEDTLDEDYTERDEQRLRKHARTAEPAE